MVFQFIIISILLTKMPSKKIRTFIDENAISGNCDYCDFNVLADCKTLNVKMRLHVKANHPTENPMKKFTHSNQKSTLLSSKRLATTDAQMLKGTISEGTYVVR